MNNKLITALRQTVDALDAETFAYNWNFPNQCNCGALFCALTGKTPAELDPLIPDNGKEQDWTEKVGLFCPISALPTNELFLELYSYGLTAADMVNLEYLSDPRVLAKMTLPVEKKWFKKPKKIQIYDNQKYVAQYMRIWADILSEEKEVDKVNLKKEEVYV